MSHSLILYFYTRKEQGILALLTSTSMSYFDDDLNDCVEFLDVHKKPELEEYTIIVPEELM